MKHLVFSIFSLALTCALLTSCDYLDMLQESRRARSLAIVSIGDKHLYQHDINKIIPPGSSTADSAKIADGYIRRWAVDILTYENAKLNTPNQDEIEQLVKDYRRSLIIHYYKQNMVREKVKMPTDDDIHRFVAENNSLFPLAEPAIKGLAISLPSNNSKTRMVKDKLKKYDENLEFLEKFAMQSASGYLIFTDQWTTPSKLSQTLNIPKFDITGTGITEITDSTTITLIQIADYIPAGEPSPEELIKEKARLMLYGNRKMDYLQNFDRDIYDYAVETGKIKFNNK